MSTKLDHILIHMKLTIITSFLSVGQIRYAVSRGVSVLKVLTKIVYIGNILSS